MSRAKRAKKENKNSKIWIFIVCIVIIIVVICLVNMKNNTSKENVIAEEENTQIENELIDEENIIEENTISNEEDNTVENVANTYETENTTNVLPEAAPAKPAVTDQKQRAIELVKQEWGEDDTVNYVFDYINENGEYVVAVKDKSSATVKNYFRVNLETETVELD